MGNNDWVAGYRAAVSELMAEHGYFVRLEAYEYRRWTSDDDYDEFSTTYGWKDWYHRDECRVVEWDLASLRERTLSQFEGTFTDNSQEVGMEMKGTCACGKYKNKWVRYTGTLSEALEVLLRA